MRAGDLRHRGTIQEQQRVQIPGGGYETQWVDVVTVWAALEPLRGREQIEAQQLQAKVTHRIRIRYRRNVKPAHRMTVGSRVFNFVSVFDKGERCRELEILAEEVVK